MFRKRPRIAWRDAKGVHETTIEERTTIGSADAAGVVVAHKTVSRLHAELDPREDGLWVRELGSKNGCYIGDVRIEAGRVPPNTTLRLGAIDLTVAYDPEPASVELWEQEGFGPLLGVSAPMRALFARLARVAPTDAAVLVRGETGTGKELIARALHEASPRREGAFVVVDCAALPESLLEAELFGHARGAFTGAATARSGAFEAAEGGTVFLDEVGELPPSVQPKLLRVLESKQVKRLGETQHRTVDFRFLSATHRDLRRMVNEGAFREDLYFRLAVLDVVAPPLRSRPEDMPLLLRHLLGADAGLATPEVLRAAAERPWLGNVRELRNFAERLRALGVEEALAMSERKPASVGEVAQDRPPGNSFERPYREAREACLDDFERAYFKRLLELHERNVPAVAAAAGVDRTYVYKLIKRHGL